MLRSKLILALSVLLLPLSSQASPITYPFHAGVATVSVASGNTILSTDTAAITGTFVTFDDAIPALTDFEFVVDDTGIDLGPLGTVNAHVTATDAPGFIAPAIPTGVDQWSWAGGPYNLNGSLDFTSGPFNGQNVALDLTLPDLTGFFRTGTFNGQDFSVTTAVDLFHVTLRDVDYKVQVRWDFNGRPVPEPATAVLFAAGLAGIAARRRKA